MPTLLELQTAVLEYTTYDEPTFVASINAFIRASEERIFYFVQLPNFKRNMTGNFTASNQYLRLPDDFLAPASLAVILASGEYVYLLNKDINFMREAYPNPTVEGVPSHYALFDVDANNTDIIVGKTPDEAYNVQLSYFYRPTSLTLNDTPTNSTWLSERAYDTLLYGTLAEASVWMKKNAGIDNMSDTYDQRFLVGLQGLKNLGEVRDRKDTYRGGEKRGSE